MWLICALLTFVAWGAADLFYKKASNPADPYSHLKIVSAVGLVMGLHAVGYLVYMGISGLVFDPVDLLRYLPVSAFYIASMTVGYFGLRYLELSISSPIQNSSGAVTAILLLLIFRTPLAPLEYAGILVVCLAVLLLSISEKREEERLRTSVGEVVAPKYRKGVLAITFPLLYCLLDGVGTFLDGVYLDELSLIGEHSALVAYELTFFLVGLGSYLYLRLKKKIPVRLFDSPWKVGAALLETAGQFFYVFAMGDRAVVAAPLIASYCALSTLLSRLVLKEKLRPVQVVLIVAVMGGILLMGLAEGLAY